MLRKLVILGVVAGGSASVPALYESNPDLFGGLVRSAAERKAAPGRLAIQQAKLEAPREQSHGRKVRIAADARGHFQADTRINGRSVEALVDTGATLVAINRSTARRVGINPMPSEFRHEVRTANGVAQAAATKIETMQIGRIQLKNVDAMILDDSALSSTLIGMSFLKQLSSFRIEDGTLVMEQ